MKTILLGIFFDSDGQATALVVILVYVGLFCLWRYVIPAFNNYNKQNSRRELEDSIEWQQKVMNKYGVDVRDEMEKNSEIQRKISEDYKETERNYRASKNDRDF